MKNTRMATWALAAFASIAAISAVHAAQDDKAHEAMMADMQKMMSQMKMPSSGDTDQDFAMMMKMHHQGAVDMAKTELKYGKDTKLRAMAEEMIAKQTNEIKDLETWQSQHKK